MNKKNLCLTLIGIVSMMLVGCDNKSPSTEKNPQYPSFRIVYSNDFHGVTEPKGSYPGLVKYFSHIKSLTQDKENTLLIGGGDMYQGSGMSSLTNGKVVVDAMNNVGFDACVIGNHEFDWGKDVLIESTDGIEKDFDATKNQEANPEITFPYLGCNVYYNNGTTTESDDTLCEFVKPYEIFEKQGLKIGLIGYIGDDQLSSISFTIGSEFSFHDPVDEVAKYAEELRTTKNCDIVIAAGHDGRTYKEKSNEHNNRLDALTGNQKIDLILNAHTHTDYVDHLAHGTYALQASAYGKMIGLIDMSYNTKKHEVSDVSCRVIDCNSIQKNDSELQAIYDRHYNSTKDTLYEKLGTIKSNITTNAKDDIAHWVSDCLKHETNSDFGFSNYGGVRTSGFPLYAGDFLFDHLFGIMPFDNCIVTCKLTGREIKGLLKFKSIADDLSVKNVNLINDSQSYTCCFDEYSFGKYIFNGSRYNPMDIVYTSYIVRDAMKKEIVHQAKDLGMDFNYRIEATY